MLTTHLDMPDGGACVGLAVKLSTTGHTFRDLSWLHGKCNRKVLTVDMPLALL